MMHAKCALIVLLSACPLGCAMDDIAWGDVAADGTLENRALDVPVAMARGADNFFISNPMDSHDWTHVSVVRKSLLAQLKTSASSAKVAALEEALRPIFTAMPKDSAGRLNNGTARYALHRLFSQRQGWSIKGLQPAGAAWLTSMSVTPDVKDIIKYMVPTYLQDMILEQKGVSSFDLHTLAILAATIEHLIHAEMESMVYSVYTTLELPIPGKRTDRQVNEILDAFMLMYSFGVNLDVSNAAEVAKAKLHLDGSHTGWPQLQAFVQEVKRDTFANPELTFDEIVQVTEKIGEKYVRWQGRDCSQVKDELAAKPTYSKGALKLSEISSYSPGGRRKLLTESKEDLQKLGALRESSDAEAQLIIPNYINSQSMCLSTASFYAACCLNECEGLLAKLEQAVRSPAAKPEELAHSMKTVHQVELPEVMVRDLADVIDQGTGLVPLHSRAFAQWMHRAFPLQCPAPDATHSQKVTNPKTADEWIGESGLEVAELEEMMKEVARTLAQYTTMGTKGGNHTSANDEPVSDSSLDIVSIRREVDALPTTKSRHGILATAFRLAAIASMLVVGVATAKSALAATCSQKGKKGVMHMDWNDFA